MIYFKKPEGFTPQFEVVSCFVEADGQILLLLRQDRKPQGNTWGVPAGKRKPHEDLHTALVREIGEETGFQPLFGEPSFYRVVFVRYPEFDFVYYIYHLDLPRKIEVQINPMEHKAFVWVNPGQSLDMPLIGGLDECIKLFYKL